MAVLNFPQNPALDDEYAADTGVIYKYNGYAWEVATTPSVSLENRVLVIETSMAELLPWTKL
jgi:hypothetical protein